MSVVQWDGRWDEQIKSEGNREVLRVSECKEGRMRQVRASVRQSKSKRAECVPC